MYKKSTGSKVLFQETTQASPIISALNNENKLFKRSNSTNTKHRAAFMATGADMQENVLKNHQSSSSQGVIYAPSIHDQPMIMNNHNALNRPDHLHNHNTHHVKSVSNGSSGNSSSRSYLHLFSSLKRTKKKSSKNKAYRSTAFNDNSYNDGNQMSKHVLNEFNRSNTSASILANRTKNMSSSSTSSIPSHQSNSANNTEQTTTTTTTAMNSKPMAHSKQHSQTVANVLFDHANQSSSLATHSHNSTTNTSLINSINSIITTSNAIAATTTTSTAHSNQQQSNVTAASSNSSPPSSSSQPVVQSIATPGASASSQASNGTSNSNAMMSGYLQKWTNYIKGYQKRWFQLENGRLSYYRSPNEMDHTCRGVINLANAVITSEDQCHFVINNGSTQTFHLKAANEVEKQKWINALEFGKNKDRQNRQLNPSNPNSVSNTFEQDSDDEDSSEMDRIQFENMLRELQYKLNELSLSHEVVIKQSSGLLKSLSELENVQTRPDENIIKTINEKSTVFKIGVLQAANHFQEFVNLAQLQSKKMSKILQSEKERRARLEEMIHDMAKQNFNIETQLNKQGKRNKTSAAAASSNANANQLNTTDANKTSGTRGSSLKKKSNQEKSEQDESKSKQSTNAQFSTPQNQRQQQQQHQVQDDEDEENLTNEDEFHDAVEDVTQICVTLPRKSTLHHRNPSNISKVYLQESDISSGDEETGQTIKVTMHHASLKEKSKHDAQQQQLALVLQNKQQSRQESSSNLSLLKGVNRQVRPRRKEITPRPNYSLNLWSIMKNCIGKDLSRIPIPVNFSEPLSMLQRVTEELEYSNLLDLAAQCDDQWEQMALVAAFTVTSYSTTATRTNKPFNPLLGETYECDRLDDFGWRSISEQVSHHPPGFALHVESLKDWVYYQEFSMSSKFRGQYLQVIPLGTSHLEFKKTGDHYTWRKVATFVRNIIVGKLWIDNVGEMDIVNHRTKDVCHLKYFPYSYFSRDPPRKVTGIITDSNNVARYVLNGTWTEQIEGAPVLNPQVVTEQTQLNTGASKVLWKRRYPPAHLESMYNFTELAVQLNEPEDGVAPTDSRLRPDQRLMELAKWDEANSEKLRLEEKQRTNRKQREQSLALASQQSLQSLQASLAKGDNDDISLTNNHLVAHSDHDPVWFKKVVDPYTNQSIHVFKNEYWDCKQRQDWKRCPDLF